MAAIPTRGWFEAAARCASVIGRDIPAALRLYVIESVMNDGF
jgi:hypothetical protein